MKYTANLCEAKVIKGQRALAWECTSLRVDFEGLKVRVVWVSN
jgi:hypothetical protein